jgi:hypothetical protein
MFRALILALARTALPAAIKGGRTMKITRTLGVMVVVGLATAASLSLAGIHGSVQVLVSKGMLELSTSRSSSSKLHQASTVSVETPASI